jgi:hypothetical protein
MVMTSTGSEDCLEASTDMASRFASNTVRSMP